MSVAVVTGASQGIGQATALRLARDFSVIVLVARSKDNLEKTADGVKAAGAEAMALAVDSARAMGCRGRYLKDYRTFWQDRRLAQYRRGRAPD